MALLLVVVAVVKAARVRKVRSVAENFSKLGFDISAEEIMQVAGEGTVGKPHVERRRIELEFVARRRLQRVRDRRGRARSAGEVPAHCRKAEGHRRYGARCRRIKLHRALAADE